MTTEEMITELEQMLIASTKVQCASIPLPIVRWATRYNFPRHGSSYELFAETEHTAYLVSMREDLGKIADALNALRGNIGCIGRRSYTMTSDIRVPLWYLDGLPEPEEVTPENWSYV